MPHEINRGENLRVGGEVLRGLEQIPCEQIVRILAELVLSQQAHKRVNVCWTHKGQQRTTHYFQRTVDTLADDTNVEEYVDHLLSLVGAQGYSSCRRSIDAQATLPSPYDQPS